MKIMLLQKDVHFLSTWSCWWRLVKLWAWKI